ncbi:MAG: DUF2130 domain-containing protein, partial [Actinobacteria bacterium]|nr:DUF2130 domain-containing protein [Actinomycetota bacterium]
GKKGDVLVSVDACSGPARGRIVFEAKDVRNLTRPRALDYLERSLANRGAEYAVLVMPSEDQMPPRCNPLREINGDKLFVTYDPADGSTLALEVAYSLARARVLMARDAGDGSSGYCGQVSGCMLEFSRTNHEIAYLALSVSDGAPGVLYATGSGGRSGWEPRSVPGDTTDPEPAQGIEQLAVDPVDPGRVWIDNGGLAVSADAGTSWTRVEDGTDGFRVGLDVALEGGGSRALVLASSQRSVPAPVSHAAVGSLQGLSPVGGAMGLAGARIDSVDHAQVASQTVAAGPDGVYALEGDAFVRVDEELVASYGPARDVQGIVHPQVEAYAMLGTGAVLVYHPTEPPPPPEPELPPLEIPPPPEAEPASLTPFGARVPVDPGETVTVDYELDLPAQPIPVDVFFLLDTSDTMGPLIQGLATGLDGLIRDLVGAHLDIRFGLAEFQGAFDSGGVRYRLRRQLTRPDTAFQHSLESIKELGGHEPHLTALDQMVTGSGIPNPSRGRAVPAGMGATWRPESLRIAVLASNEPYGEPPGTTEYCYPTPNYEDPEAPPEPVVMQRLRDAGVLLIGVEYLYDQREDPNRDGISADLCMTQHPGGTSPLRVQMDRWSGATGAAAPRGGIDCDVDGNVDLHEGDPLVCSLPMSRASGVVELKDALVRMILAVEQPRLVQVTAASDSGAVVSVEAAGDFSAIDVRSDNLLGFTAAFSCTPDQAGTSLPVTLTGTLDGAQIAQAPATVLCGPQPDEEAPPPEVPQPGAPAAPAPAPPPALAGPPPAPAPVAAGAPAAAQAQAAATGGAAAAAPVVAPGLAPGGAVVDGGPTETQVRLAHNQARNQRRERLMLATAHSQEEEHLPVIVWGAAALLFGAATTVARGRDRRVARIR